MEICSLPDVVIFKILDHIDSPFDLINLGETSEFFNHLIYEHCEQLWIKLTFEWCDGLWSYLPKLSIDDNAASNWLRCLLNVIASVRPPTCHFFSLHDNIEQDNSIHWKRCESNFFRCMMTMWKLTFSEHHHKHLSHPAVLDYNFVHDMAIYSLDNKDVSEIDPSVYFNNVLQHEKNIITLADVGKAAKYDPRNRKKKHVTYSMYVKKVKECPFYEEFFGDVDKENAHGSPPLPCSYIQPCNSSEEMLFAVVLILSRMISHKLEPLSFKKLIDIPSVAALISDITKIFCLMHSLLWNDRQVDSYKLIIEGVKNPDFFLNDDIFQDVAKFRFEVFQENLFKKYSHLPISLNLPDIALELSKTLENIDFTSEIRKIRNKWLDPLLRIIKKTLSCDKNLVQVNLTDSSLIGGDNNQQQMISSCFVSQSKILVIWQLIGPPRY